MGGLEKGAATVKEALAHFMAESARILAAIREDIAEVRLSNARTDRRLLEMQQQADADRQRADADRQRAEQERREFNRRLAEIADAQGLLIENMV